MVLTVPDFIGSRTGKYSNFPASRDPAQSHQCVALFWDYNQAVNVGEAYPGGNGADLFDIEWTSYAKVPNTSDLKYGDWVSWSGNYGAYPNGGAGHAAMWVGENDATSGYFFTQNPDTASVILLQYAGIKGYLRTEITPMTITINERLTAKHWTGAAYVPAAWGIGPRVVTSITIHWWGNPVGQTYEGILDWFCNPQSSVGTSAHYVVSAGQAACIVSPWDASWHAGSAYGNVHSIGIECNPRCSAGDYQTIAEVVANIRAMYGNIPLFTHNHWTNTTCPGDYRLAKIDALAATITGKSTTVTPIPLEDTLSAKDVNAITAAILKEGKETRDYVAALLLKGWSLGGVNHPGIGMVVEENQRRINRLTKDALTPAQVWGYKNVGDTKDVHQVLQDAAAPATVELDTAGVQSIAAQLETQLGTGIVAKIAEQWNK